MLKKVSIVLLLILCGVWLYLSFDSEIQDDVSQLPPPPSIQKLSSDLAGSLTTMEFWKFEEGEDYAIADSDCGFGQDKMTGRTYEVNGQKLNVLPVYAFEDKKVSELMAKVRNTLGKRAVVLYYDAQAGLDNPDNGFMEFLSTFYNKPALDANNVIPALRPLFIISPENDLIKFCGDRLPANYQLQMPAGDDYWDMVYLPTVDAANRPLRKAYNMNLFDGSDEQLVYDGDLEGEFLPGVYRVGIIADALEDGNQSLCFGQGCEREVVELINSDLEPEDPTDLNIHTGDSPFNADSLIDQGLLNNLLNSRDNNSSSESSSNGEGSSGFPVTQAVREAAKINDNLALRTQFHMGRAAFTPQGIEELTHWQTLKSSEDDNGFETVDENAVGLVAGYNSILEFVAPVDGSYEFDLSDIEFNDLASHYDSDIEGLRDSQLKYFETFSMYLMKNTANFLNSSEFYLPEGLDETACGLNEGDSIIGLLAKYCDYFNVFSIADQPISYYLAKGDKVYINLGIDLEEASEDRLTHDNFVKLIDSFTFQLKLPNSFTYNFKYSSNEWNEGLRRGDYTTDPDQEFEEEKCVDIDTGELVFCN